MSVPSFESILQNFRYRRGLYLLGADSSAGLAPVGHGLYRIAALDWWRNGGGFSPDIPVHSPLVQKIIESRMIDIHGSIDPWYGSPGVKELIALAYANSTCSSQPAT